MLILARPNANLRLTFTRETQIFLGQMIDFAISQDHEAWLRRDEEEIGTIQTLLQQLFPFQREIASYILRDELDDEIVWARIQAIRAFLKRGAPCPPLTPPRRPFFTPIFRPISPGSIGTFPVSSGDRGTTARTTTIRNSPLPNNDGDLDFDIIPNFRYEAADV